MLDLSGFCRPGRTSFIVGGQWGSEGKGAAAAWLAKTLNDQGRGFDIITTNAGAQAGHTSVHQGVKRVVFHLPTVPIISNVLQSIIYLNAGSIIDPIVFLEELKEHEDLFAATGTRVFIHPNAAVITDECRFAEGRNESAQTQIASTRKGVGEALSRKVLRSGLIARDCAKLKPFLRRVDLNERLYKGQSVLVEVPQGIGLSINWKFYPHCTSRDCTVMQAMSDAHIHPTFVGQTVLVLRTFPIRVGNIKGHDDQEIGNSGSGYPFQKETSWDALGVPPEITTVTKRVRRVFEWSVDQLRDALVLSRPQIVYLTFCDYVQAPSRIERLVHEIRNVSISIGLETLQIVCQSGPTTDDAYIWNGERAA